MKTLCWAMLMIVLFAALSGCAAPNGLEVTPMMVKSMNDYADHVDALYPQMENVARTCAEKPTGIYWNKQYQAYAVTCSLKMGQGVVTIDQHENVIASFSLSQENYSAFLLDGWETQR